MASYSYKPITAVIMAFDIERTGIRKGDRTSAVGWAIGRISLRDDNVVTFELLSKDSVCLDLGFDLTDYQSILAGYRKGGYEERCLNEFWNNPKDNKLDTLRNLQDPTLVTLVATDAELADTIQDALVSAEKTYGSVAFLCNTFSFDAYYISKLLEDHGYAPLQYTREFRMKRGHELNSWLSGAVDSSPLDSRADQATATSKVQAVTEVVHDHDPKNDAHSILLRFANVLGFIHKDREESRKDKLWQLLCLFMVACFACVLFYLYFQ